MNSKWILWTGHKYSSTAASSGDRKCGKGGEGALKVPCSWGALGSRQTHVRLIRIGRLSEVDLPETFIPPLLWDASIFSSIRGFFFLQSYTSIILHTYRIVTEDWVCAWANVQKLNMQLQELVKVWFRARFSDLHTSSITHQEATKRVIPAIIVAPRVFSLCPGMSALP